MEAERYFETSALICKTTLYHIQNDSDIYIKVDFLIISCLTTILQVYNLYIFWLVILISKQRIE
jgi:hypothetical protein